MTHKTSSCMSCDWCEELEPEAGTFSRTGPRYSDTVLCPDCSPDEEVSKGVYMVFNFTMDEEDNTIPQSVKDYLESKALDSDWTLVANTGLKASTEGHTRANMVFALDDGLSHFRVREFMRLKTIIDSSNGDPQRNNSKAHIYNYNPVEVIMNETKSEERLKNPYIYASNHLWSANDAK